MSICSSVPNICNTSDLDCCKSPDSNGNVCNKPDSLNDLSIENHNFTSLSNPYIPIKGAILTGGKDHTDALSAATNAKIHVSLSWRPTTDNNLFEKISKVKSQGGCGCCWAVASTTALSDRFAIKHEMPNPDLSFAYTVSCIGPDSGVPSSCQCDRGGDLQTASCGFLNPEKGGRLDTHYPSFNVPKTIIPKCGLMKPCGKGTDYIFNTTGRAHLISSVKIGGIVSILDTPNKTDETNNWNMIKLDIQTNGPLPTTILEWNPEVGGINEYLRLNDGKDFDELPIYNPQNISASQITTTVGKKEFPGGHALVIVGWSAEDYWVIRNSWGVANSPGGGYFKYKMVHNDPSCLTVPRIYLGSLAGGAWTFTAGDKPSGYTPLTHDTNTFTSSNTSQKISVPDTPAPTNPTIQKLKSFFTFKKDGELNLPLVGLVTFGSVILVILLISMLIPQKN